MENLIEFFDLKTGAKGRKLNDKNVSVWYNTKYNGYNVTFSNDIDTHLEYVKIGKLGDNLCFVFNSEEGLRLTKVGTTNKNLKFSSKDFIEMIFGRINEVQKTKDRKVFEMQKINDTIYTFNPLKTK